MRAVYTSINDIVPSLILRDIHTRILPIPKAVYLPFFTVCYVEAAFTAANYPHNHMVCEIGRVDHKNVGLTVCKQKRFSGFYPNF